MSGDKSHLFRKGVSGNPNGRPKGLERRVRELLENDLDRMTLAMRDIVLGERQKKNTDGTPALDREGRPVMEPVTALNGEKITTRDRIEAYKVLTDRGWGKPRQTIDMTGELNLGERVDTSKWTEDQLRLAAALDAGVVSDTEH